MMKGFLAYTIWPQVVLPIRARLDHAYVILRPNYVFPNVSARDCVVIVHGASASYTKVLDHLINADDLFSPLVNASYHWVLRRYICLALVHAKAMILPIEKLRSLTLQVTPQVVTPVIVVPWGVTRNWMDPPPLFDVDANDRSSPLYLLCADPHHYKPIAPISEVLTSYRYPAIGARHTTATRTMTVRVVVHRSASRDNAPGVEHRGRVSDEALARLHRGASPTIIPMTNSGFGLPVPEALASGCPCILRTGTAEAEIAAGHGVYAVGGEIASWVDATKDRLRDPLGRKEPPRDGYSCARLYSWERTGPKLADSINMLPQEQ